jgi:hypothetical protein
VGDIGLAAAIMVKITPLMLLAIPVLQMDWKRLLRIGSGMGVLALMSGQAFGLSPWAEFWEIFPRLFQEYYYLTTMLKEIVDQATITLIGRISSAFILAIWGGVLLWQTIVSLGLSHRDLRASKMWELVQRGPKIVWAERQRFTASLIAWSITVMTISSSLLWYHHLVFLVMPLVVLLLDTEERVANWPVIFAGISALLIQAARLAEFRALGSWFLYAGCLSLFVALGISVIRSFSCLERAQDRSVPPVP